MSNRAFLTIGGVVAAGGAYYLYKAGGDPKAAEKRFERDISKVSSSVKSELPGKKDEVKGDAKVFAADAGKKLDDWTKDAKAGLSKADAKLEQYRTSASQNIDATLKDARREANAAVDKFDKNVTEGASKAKGSISSWFGGSK